MTRHLAGLVRNAAVKQPDRDAVVMHDQRLTYAALDSLATRFASSLRGHGVTRGERVVLWLPKSPAAVAALYGAMRCGAAYVPVDPAAPLARFAAIARDAECSAVVVSADRVATAAQALAPVDSVRAIWVTGAAPTEPQREPRSAAPPVVTWSEVEAEPETAERIEPAADDLAYVLYTSGSTGKPKGVMHTHASALAFVDWAAAEFHLTAEDRLSNHAPLHFDLSTFDLFGAARAGASVYPVPPRAMPFPAAIAQLYAGERLTVVYETPSALSLLLRHGQLAAHDLSALRLLLFAGEVMPPALLCELMGLAPQARFVNLYGPTETNVCTWHDVGAAPKTDASIPIGVACSSDAVHVLDEALRPVSGGEIGELWVSGASLMRGYWGDPETTHRVLRVLELGDRETPAYRTGDLASRTPTGQLLFHGRLDHQVKTRGYRVELGEIESTLLSHAAVAEAVVLAPTDPDIGTRLEAVVVLKSPAEPADLKTHCAGSLPRYMVPEVIETRSALPRTASGKIDRAVLGAEAAARRRSA